MFPVTRRGGPSSLDANYAYQNRTRPLKRRAIYHLAQSHSTKVEDPSMKTLLRTLTAIGLLSLIAPFAASDVNAQTMVSRARVGGYAEEITLVTSGTLKDKLVMMNGYELYSVELTKKATLTRVCKIDNPELDQFVNGLTFVPSEGLFVMNNAP